VDLSALQPHDPTSLAWAIAWTRSFLRDTSSTPTYSDPELAAGLTARAFTVGDSSYYRPHVLAAALVQADPARAQSESLLGASVTHRDPASVAAGIRARNVWIDDLIEAASGARPPLGRALIPGF
jgi:hypothetical protein